MGLALGRARLGKVAFWVILVLSFAAWVAAVALKAPWRGWFLIAFWVTIGIGLIVRFVRFVRQTGERRARLDAFREFDQMYLGRTQSPSPEKPPVQSVEIGYPLPTPETTPDAQAPMPSRRPSDPGHPGTGSR